METFEEAFPNYVVTANTSGRSFYIFVLAYSCFAFILIYPLMSCSWRSEEKFTENPELVDLDHPSNKDGYPTHEEAADRVEMSPQIRSTSDAPKQRSKPTKSFSFNESRSGGQGMLSRVAASSYPDSDPDFKSRISSCSAKPKLRSRSSSRVSNQRSGAVVSAATTSRIILQSSTSKGSRVFDVSGRRWKHRRPIGRVDVIQNAIHRETKSIVSKHKQGQKGISDVASSILAEENHAGNPAFLNRSALKRHRLHMMGRGGSCSTASQRSTMSSIVDDISPEDAADANDPGRGNIFIHKDIQILQEEKEQAKFATTYQAGFWASVFDLAKPTEELRRVLRMTFPLSIGASSEGLFRLITASFISQYLGSESMIAFLLAGLFVRLTSEGLAGAIIDALSSFLELSVFSEESDGLYLSGQYIQVAILLQLVLGIPLLVVWALQIDKVVYWLLQSSVISSIALEYVQIAVAGYILQSVSRTYTAVFHICGHEHFESMIDFTTSTLQMITIACVVTLVEKSKLTTVAYIQILFNFCSLIAKFAYPVMKGWDKPFREGTFKNCALFQNRTVLWHLLRVLVPLVTGSILEYGEWEVLTILLKFLGPAEVGTWSLLGALWDVLEAFTEGIGEASAIQVAFLLAAAQPERAKKLSYSILYVGFIQSLLVTSCLYMGGRYLAILVTNDQVLQYMTNESLALLGLANITMSFSQVAWSLIGAQGRFRLGTKVMFFSRWLVTIPLACVTIFFLYLDLSCIGGCLVVGYSTASCVLTCIVLKSDWERLMHLMQEVKSTPFPEKQELDFDFDDDFSSSEGFGSDVDREEASDGKRRKSAKRQVLRHRPHENP